jgi:acetyl esterase/lipase
MVVCPGGGYSNLMEDYEGHDIARWVNRFGITGIVLKYRVGIQHPAPLLDAQRAMRIVRVGAAEWGISPNRIGVIGFSAGGHLAAMLGTHFDDGSPSASDPIERAGCRPDWMVLVYPVITLDEKSLRNVRTILLGAEPAPELVSFLSCEKHVTARTPPSFLVHSVTDQVVPVSHSAMFYAALKRHQVPCEFLELPEGAHGLGTGTGPLWSQWQGACMHWLATNGVTG